MVVPPNCVDGSAAGDHEVSKHIGSRLEVQWASSFGSASS